MEIAQPPVTTAAKSPETETDYPTRIQPTKPISSSNGVHKRHHHNNKNKNNNSNTPITPIVVSYKECLKNHAAALGSHALDGCGDFMPSLTSTPSDPNSLKCAACGCHRNFHRREPEDNLLPPLTPATYVIEYQPHHRHRPPPPLTRSPNSASPPPISSSYYPSAPHMLLALSSGISDNPNTLNAGHIISPVSGAGGGHSTRKRFRTKFSQEQKAKMFRFAERVGWKMQKRDEDVVHEFCNEIGVDKGVLKVWMHNNKNTFVKRNEGVLGNGDAAHAVNNVSATVTARVDNNTSSNIGHHNQIHDNMNGIDNNNNTTSNEDEDDHPRLPSHHHHKGGGSLSNLGNIANPNRHHYQVGRDHPQDGSSSST